MTVRTNKPTKVPATPPVPASVSPELRRYLEQVTETIEIRLGRRGDQRDRAVTLRELIDSGLAKDLRTNPFDPNNSGNTGFVIPGGTLQDLAVPPAPTGFSANGAFSQVNLSWDYPKYANHSLTEIWRHDSDSIGDAQLVGVQGGRFHVDPVGSGFSGYYWVRHVNTSDVAGPFNAAAGTLAQTAVDVAHLLTLLTGAITTGQLATALSTEISDATTNITSLQNTYGSTAAAATSAAAAAASQAAALLNQQGAETAKNSAVVAKTAAETAQAAAGVSETNSANSATGAAGSAATAESHKNTAATAANNSAASAASSATQASNAAASATASSQSATASDTAKVAAETAKSGAETAETNSATSETNAAGSAASASTSATNAATAAGNAATSATAANTSAAASAASNTSAGQSATAASASQSAASTSAANASTSETNAASSETNAAGSASAAASTVNGLTARLNNVNNTGSGGAVTVEQAYSVSASNAGDINDLEGQYTVKIDNNGAVAGFGLASSTTAAGGITSEFIVNADRFAIMRGGSNTATATVPFTVQATATTINGQSVPAGVYMADAFIKNGSILAAKIGSLNADTISSGTVNAGRIGANTIDASKLVLDNATMTSQTINGVPTLIVNELNANKLTSGVLNTSRINLDGATITANSSGQIQIKDLGVDTLQIKGQAVTIPSSDVLATNFSLTTSYQNILTISWTSTGAPTVVFVVVEWDGSGNAGGYTGSGQLKHGNTTVQSFSLSGNNNVVYRRTMMMNITPSVGVNTVTLTGKENQSFANSIEVAATNTSIFLLETKK